MTLETFMLNVVYAKCPKYAFYDDCYYAECHFAESRYDECHYAECRGVIKNVNLRTTFRVPIL